MQKVFVGLSGGVDSGTSAALLKEQGCDVTGVFIKIWQPEFIECTWREDRMDAMRVAASLGIPFREIDLSEEYKKEVVETMVRDYRSGITPNPDVLCNEKIKFGAFLRWALAEGADKVATGHYARTVLDKTSKDGPWKFRLLRGVDPLKDQSYFLHRLSAADLSRILFPIGEMTKQEVRLRAKEFGLPVAQKPDSQGLCFVGDVSMREFLQRYIKVEKGAVLDMQGHVIGEHDGAALYTIGERQGLSISKDPGPHFVVMIDVKANTLTVSTNREDAARGEVTLQDLHWMHDAPTLPFAAEAQTRYRGKPVRAELAGKNGDIACTFNQREVISFGQSLVFYDGDTCLGGGIMHA